MKRLHLTILSAVLAVRTFAGNLPAADTTIGKAAAISPIFKAIDVEPQYPGGTQKFYRFLEKRLRYPEVAELIGLSGIVYVSFVVDKTGEVGNVQAVKCLGAGCESEAIRIVAMSPNWTPGSQNGKPVKVAYTIPITFQRGKDIVYLKHLRKSQFGFVFSIKGKLYTIDEAQKIIGRSYTPNELEDAELFYNADKDQRFEMADKKEVYLLKFTL
jgi:periplasmic protein TonB